MDKIWFINPSRSLAVVSGMTKPNDHTGPTKSGTLKKHTKKHLSACTFKIQDSLSDGFNIDTKLNNTSVLPLVTYSPFCQTQSTTNVTQKPHV